MVVTAAHCVYGFGPATNFRVWAGGYDTNDISVGKIYGVSRIIVHESYDPALLQDDIALLIVYPQILFSRTVSPICLP